MIGTMYIASQQPTEERGGLTCLEGLSYFFFFFYIQKHEFFGKNLLVNEFQTTLGGGLLGI